MSGYEWHQMVRMTPDNGAAEVMDLRTAFSDASGPVRTTPRYRDESEYDDDVNLITRAVHRGLRPEVTLRMDIATMADQANLATIVSRLMRPDWSVELSLDGGVTYRGVRLSRPPTPRGFRGKTVAGATFDLSLRCTETIDDYAAMMTAPGDGLRQVLTNEGFEDWTGSVLDNWGQEETYGTVDEDTSDQRTGRACVSITRTDTGLQLDVWHLQSQIIVPSAWCEIGGYVKASGAITDGLNVRIENNTQATFVKADGTTWISGPVQDSGKAFTLTTSYAAFAFKFRADPDYALSDSYRMRFYNEGAISDIIYLDDCYLHTPVLPPKVATW